MQQLGDAIITGRSGIDLVILRLCNVLFLIDYKKISKAMNL